MEGGGGLRIDDLFYVLSESDFKFCFIYAARLQTSHYIACISIWQI